MFYHRTARLLMISFVMFLMLRAASTQANNYYVAVTGSDNNPGTKTLPFLTIQHGLTTAQAGDTVFVIPGSFSGAGNIDLDFGGKALRLLRYGNKSGTVTLDCQKMGRGFHFHMGETQAAVVDGFTIINAHAPDGVTDPVSGDGTDGAPGGGILIEGGSSPTIRTCSFTNDTAGNGGSYIAIQGSQSGAGGAGGAIYVNGGAPLIKSCTFSTNSAGSGGDATDFLGSGGNGGAGGALAVSAAADIVIEDSLFSGNTGGNGGFGSAGFIGDGAKSGGGGGIEIDGGSARILRCTLSNNVAGSSGPTGTGASAPGGAGGGVNANGAAVTISDCQLTGNHAGKGESAEFNTGAGGAGGGIALNGGSASSILRCVLLGNQAGSVADNQGADGGGGNGGAGGGISVTNADPTILDCIVEGNSAGNGGSFSNFVAGNGGNGGGISLQSGGDAVITNCLIASNVAGMGGFSLSSDLNSNGGGGNGGGVSADGTSIPVLDNCTIAFNLAGAGGVSGGAPNGAAGVGGGLDSVDAAAKVTNSILYFDTDSSNSISEVGGTAAVSFTDVQGGPNDLGDPLFVRKPGTNGGGDPGDFHLQSGSPCIDVGSNAAVPRSVHTDLDGDPRIVNGIVDLGAYEFQLTADVTAIIGLQFGGVIQEPVTSNYTQRAALTNTGVGPIAGPICLVLDNLPKGVKLTNASGRTMNAAPTGSPYIQATSLNLAPGAISTVTLKFSNPMNVPISYTPRILSGGKP